MDLSNWDAFGRGWTTRCKRMLQLARTRIQKRPALSEMVSSKTIGAAAASAATGSTLLLPWLQDLLSDLPEMLQSAEPGISQGRAALETAHAIPGIGGHLAVAGMVGLALYTGWRRYKDWRLGRR
jgi:hypothetical protein